MYVQGPMVILGGWVFLMSEVPLYLVHELAELLHAPLLYLGRRVLQALAHVVPAKVDIC